MQKIQGIFEVLLQKNQESTSYCCIKIKVIVGYLRKKSSVKDRMAELRQDNSLLLYPLSTSNTHHKRQALVSDFNDLNLLSPEDLSTSMDLDWKNYLCYIIENKGAERKKNPTEWDPLITSLIKKV